MELKHVAVGITQLFLLIKANFTITLKSYVVQILSGKTM